MLSLSLIARFRSSAKPSVSPKHLGESEIAGFLDGDCTPSEHSRIEAHLDQCADCRVAIVEVKRIASAFEMPQHAPVPAHPPGKRASQKVKWMWLATGTALAASLTFVVLGRNDDDARLIPSAVRASDPSAFASRPALEVESPADDAELSGDSAVFRWRSTAGAVYRVLIQDETGEPVFTRETADTTIAIEMIPALAAGHLYFWRVDAISDGVTASSVIRKFRVAP